MRTVEPGWVSITSTWASGGANSVASARTPSARMVWWSAHSWTASAIQSRGQHRIDPCRKPCRPGPGRPPVPQIDGPRQDTAELIVTTAGLLVLVLVEVV